MLALALLLTQTPAQTTTEHEFTRESRGFGAQVCGAGDQDGDGVPDLVVAEDQRNALELWLLSGKDGSTQRKTRCEWETPSTAEVQDLPDVDGDGRRELLVCARPADAMQKTELHLLSGTSFERLWRVPVPRPSPGHCVGLVHDVDGDGIDDVGLFKHAGAVVRLELNVVSSKTGAVLQTLSCESVHEKGRCGFIECPDLDGDSKRDFVFLEEGQRNKPSALRAWSPARKKFLWTHEPTGEWTSSTGALALLGDVNGDSVVDFAATFLDEVRVVSGKTGETLYRLRVFPGDSGATAFGECVLALGDVDGDGICDLALSEPEALVSGNLRAYSGKSQTQLWLKSPPVAHGVSWFGRDVKPVGDVDGDGVVDLIAGSWEAQSAEPGYAALVSGRKGTPLLEFRRGVKGVVARKPDPTLPW